MSPAVNRYVTVAGFDDIEVRSEPLPTPGAGQVRVRSRLVGICGSDLHAVRGQHPTMPLPYRPGHEVVGEVDALGPAVTDFAEGDRVFIEPNLVCRSCRNCREGRYNICEQLKVFGCQTPGGMAEVFTIDADRLHRIPAGMSDQAAVLVEPLATPVHAVRLASTAGQPDGVASLEGRDVVVLGAGPIGLFTLLAARRAGARQVIVTDLVLSKRDRAVRLGAETALPADAPDLVTRVRERFGGGADVVFDCVAAPSSVAQAARLVRKGGTVMIVGVPSGTVPVPLDLVQDWEINLRGALMYVREDVLAAVEILQSGLVPVEEFVTDVLPLDRAGEAFRRATSETSVKVLVSTTE